MEGERGRFSRGERDFPVDNKVSGGKVARHGRRWASRDAALQLWAIPRRGEPRNELAILPTISKLAARTRSLPALTLLSSHLEGTGPVVRPENNVSEMKERKEGRKKRSGKNKRCTVNSWCWWPRSNEVDRDLETKISCLVQLFSYLAIVFFFFFFWRASVWEIWQIFWRFDVKVWHQFYEFLKRILSIF